MSATNHTTNYELPIFVGSDKPAWLVDWNGAMTAIDTAIHTAEGKADQAGTDIGGIESSISTINSTLTSINNAVSQLRLDTNANTGAINTIQELLGNGTPTTTDKTVIGAINELNADFGDANDLYTIKSTDTVPTFTPASGTMGSISAVKCLQSDADSVLKIFGTLEIDNLVLTGSGSGQLACTIANTGLSIPEEFTVTGYTGIFLVTGQSDVKGLAVKLIFKTNGNVEVRIESALGAQTLTYLLVMLPPCIIVNESIE